MADFAIAEGTVKARPVIVEVERMLSTTPLCAPSIQRLPAASVQYIVPCSVGARIASAARNDRCSVCAMKVAAALLTSTSSGASRQTASIMASTAAPSRMSHLIDADLAAEFAAHLRRRRLQQFEPAAADDQLGAELDEAAPHRRTEPGTAAGDQYALSRQQALFEHRLILPTRAMR